jgi:trehalose 6-phosphate phosphatase
VLGPVRAAAPDAAVLTDYDGTLAPIVHDPAEAVPAAGMTDVLGRLVGRYRRVGVVSGRPVAFLRRHLPVPGLVLVGQYGLERWDGAALVTEPAVAPWREVVAEAAIAAGRDLAPLGVRVERKGEVALALHWRERPGAEPAARDWAAAQAARLGLVAAPGRRVVELRPPVPVDKGVAVRDLCTGLRAACFAGDDLGDVPAFEALDHLAAEGVAVARVAVRSPELPEALARRADVVVDGPEGVRGALGVLAGGEPD